MGAARHQIARLPEQYPRLAATRFLLLRLQGLEYRLLCRIALFLLEAPRAGE